MTRRSIRSPMASSTSISTWKTLNSICRNSANSPLPQRRRLRVPLRWLLPVRQQHPSWLLVLRLAQLLLRLPFSRDQRLSLPHRHLRPLCPSIPRRLPSRMIGRRRSALSMYRICRWPRPNLWCRPARTISISRANWGLCSVVPRCLKRPSPRRRRRSVPAPMWPLRVPTISNSSSVRWKWIFVSPPVPLWKPSPRRASQSAPAGTTPVPQALAVAAC